MNNHLKGAFAHKIKKKKPATVETGKCTDCAIVNLFDKSMKNRPFHWQHPKTTVRQFGARTIRSKTETHHLRTNSAN